MGVFCPAASHHFPWRRTSTYNAISRLQETLHEHITDLFGLLDQLANDVAKPQSSR
ncbi:MAG: hypothetical protein WB967_27680 [Mycobacterium sp.]|uniref:hypothetical protein n=1 Tax=Mycobacterium sp. TaxID=1785 RepID=UPI003C4EC0AC